MSATAETATLPGGNTVLVEIVDRVAWVTMNRPEKRNAINPTLSFEMLDVFEALESDERCGVLVLTGVGDAYSSGMDLREYFRATDKLSYDERLKIMRRSALAQWKRLQYYGKPTIANAAKLLPKRSTSECTSAIADACSTATWPRQW